MRICVCVCDRYPIFHLLHTYNPCELLILYINIYTYIYIYILRFIHIYYPTLFGTSPYPRPPYMGRNDNYDDDDDDETTRRAALHTASPQYNTSIVCRQLRANRYTHAPHTYIYAHAHARPTAADAARS